MQKTAAAQARLIPTVDDSKAIESGWKQRAKDALAILDAILAIRE